ncbi:MAG: methionine synthase [Pseudomonadota bacterium]
MRVISILFYFIGFFGLAAWAVGYVYISALACAFGNPNNTCRAKMPWELGLEDFTGLVIIPAVLVGLTFLIAVLAGRAATKPRN